MEKAFITAGIDISRDITQLAYWKTGMSAPEMLVEVSEEEVPKQETEEICWPTVELKTARSRKKYCAFIKKVVSESLERLGEQSFDAVAFTLPEISRAHIEAIQEVFAEEALYSGTKLAFISHSESCAHYSINQKKELRMNDVAFFDFSKAGLVYRRMHVAQSAGKVNVTIAEKDCPGVVSLEFLENEETRKMMDENFKSLLNTLFDKQQVSTVYLMGEGFVAEEWAVESLNMLCKKRRVFKGRNLYAVGACYMSAQRLIDETANADYRVFCKGRTVCEICMEVIYNNERNKAVILPVAKLWYEANNEIEGIVSGIDKLLFVVNSYLGTEIMREEVSLEKLGKYQDRLARLNIATYMDNDEEIVVTIKNLGFGEFAPEGTKTIEKRFNNSITG